MGSEKGVTFWGSVGWWIVVGISIPFACYAAVFVMGDFEVYRQLTVYWVEGNYDIAGLNILQHIRAWQIHAAAAEVFLLLGPFQLSPSCRVKFPTVHRVGGYIFVATGLVSSISGIFFLLTASEFGTVAKTQFAIEGILMPFFFFTAVRTARAKKFAVHQRYMIRGAATGYSAMAVRLLPIFFVALGMPLRVAMEVSAVLAPLLYLSLAELYIQKVLLAPKLTTSEYVETSSTEEVEYNGGEYQKIPDSKKKK